MQMLHLFGGNTSPRHGIVPTSRFRFTLLSRGAQTHVTRGSLGCIRRARRRRGSSSKNGERSSRRQSALGVQPRGATRGGCRVSSPEPAFRPRREPRLASSAPTRRGRLLGVVADGPVGTAVRPVARRQRLLGIVVGIAASHLLSTLHGWIPAKTTDTASPHGVLVQVTCVARPLGPRAETRSRPVLAFRRPTSI